METRQIITPNLVFEKEGRALTSSLNVAREFSKAHKDVIRSIKDLLTLAQNCANLFEETTYKDSYGRDQILYLMDRDGFTLLAMGFTGERALEFKMKFLKAFGVMEKMLTSDDYIIYRSQQILQKRAEALQQQVQMLEGEKKMLLEENEILAPKAEYTDKVLQAPGTYTHTQMAKELNFRSVKAFLDECHKHGILFKQSDVWMLYAKFAGNGYITTHTAVFNTSHGDGKRTYSVWTEEGRRFLHEHFNVALKPFDISNLFPLND